MTAVFIENRPLPNLNEIIDRHLKFLPNWDFIHLKPPIKNAHDYNKLLTTANFWKQFKTEYVLIFQHDSGLLRKGINEFIEMDYSYIGAPIKHIPFPSMNGGLSLRKVEDQIKVLENFSYNGYRHNEDIFFCEKLAQLKCKLPTLEEAKKFSVETIFSLGSLGFHAANKYLTPFQLNQILTQYD